MTWEQIHIDEDPYWQEWHKEITHPRWGEVLLKIYGNGTDLRAVAQFPEKPYRLAYGNLKKIGKLDVMEKEVMDWLDKVGKEPLNKQG